MNNYGFNNSGNDNPLMQYLRQYVPQQQSQSMDTLQATTQEPQRGSGSGMLYEINCQADIDYIEIDKSGRMQIFICQNEKRIYTRRYNHSKQKPDYREYIEEEETKLEQNNDTSAGINQVVEALVAVASKLESMQNEIQELKNVKPKEIIKEIEAMKEAPKQSATKTNRKPNGQFKKKGED